jgi:hypothetical protein
MYNKWSRIIQELCIYNAERTIMKYFTRSYNVSRYHSNASASYYFSAYKKSNVSATDKGGLAV